jgi:hypothetical protein
LSTIKIKEGVFLMQARLNVIRTAPLDIPKSSSTTLVYQCLRIGSPSYHGDSLATRLRAERQDDLVNKILDQNMDARKLDLDELRGSRQHKQAFQAAQSSFAQARHAKIRENSNTTEESSCRSLSL